MRGESAHEEATASVTLTRIESGQIREMRDAVAAEEPLEIRVNGRSLAVTMRTPGFDEDLARGLLLTERVVRKAEHIRSVRHCSIARDPEADGNVIEVTLAPGVEVDWDGLQRNLFASASCGLCGKATLENALATAPPVEDQTVVTPEQLFQLTAELRGAQPGFDATGGLHAAALFAPDAGLLVAREDIGRHNAVDKVIGWALGEGRLPLAGHVLLTSGRISFEIAQKALAARIPIVAAVSAPSSLAVRLAEAAGLTLVGFLRGRGCNVYGRRERLVRSVGVPVPLPLSAREGEPSG